MKLYLTGGSGGPPDGPGWKLLGLQAWADVQADPNEHPWPVANATVHQAFAADFLERLKEPELCLLEIARVCVAGSPVSFEVAHPLGGLARRPGHASVVSPELLTLWCDPESPLWQRHTKRLEVTGCTFKPSDHFMRVRSLYPAWSEDSVLRYAPLACSVCQVNFTVRRYRR